MPLARKHRESYWEEAGTPCLGGNHEGASGKPHPPFWTPSLQEPPKPDNASWMTSCLNYFAVAEIKGPDESILGEKGPCHPFLRYLGKARFRFIPSMGEETEAQRSVVHDIPQPVTMESEGKPRTLVAKAWAICPVDPKA